MKTRNLSKLVLTEEFQELANNYPIKVFIKDGNLLLKNNYMYIYIYSYMTEHFPYFEIFDLSKKMKSSLSRIEYNIDSSLLIKIYDFYKTNHTKSIIKEGIRGEVLMESYFLAQIEVLKKYFPDLLNGDISKYEKYFEPLKGGYIDLFNELNDFIAKKGGDAKRNVPK